MLLTYTADAQITIHVVLAKLACAALDQLRKTRNNVPLHGRTPDFWHPSPASLNPVYSPSLSPASLNLSCNAHESQLYKAADHTQARDDYKGPLSPISAALGLSLAVQRKPTPREPRLPTPARALTYHNHNHLPPFSLAHTDKIDIHTKT
jgi:hypothetical protein